jgi:hypothetical protein
VERCAVGGNRQERNDALSARTERCVVGSQYVNGDWEEYQAYRIRRETERLYPHRHLVEGPQYCMAA